MRKTFLILMGIICTIASLHAQSPPEIKPLTIGDTVPNIQITNIVNYKDTSVNLSSFRGKLVLLDFWATWCSGCIEYLPHLDSLQKRFEEKIQIIPVTDERTEKIHTFLRQNIIGENLDLPIVTDDTLLSRFFKHTIIPHEVWIDGKGIVKAITFPEYVNTRNIHKALTGQRINWPVKKDLLDFNRNTRILPITGDEFNFVYYSTITNYIDGVPYVNNGYQQDSTKNKTRLYAINSSILELYGMTFSSSDIIPGVPFTKQLILQVSDSSRFFYNSDSIYRDAWNRKNEYCYEAIFPIAVQEKQALKKMRTDLNFFLGLNGKWENRMINCLVLKFTPENNNSPVVQNKKNPQVSLEKTDKIKFLHNAKLSNLIFALNRSPGLPVVIAETGLLNTYVSIDLGDISLSNIRQLTRALAKYGLSLKPEREKMKMFVLSENGYYPNVAAK